MSGQTRLRCASRRLLLIVAAMSLGACASSRLGSKFVVDSGQLRQGDPRATRFSVKGSLGYEKIWAAALAAMSKDMAIVESHKPSGAIKSRVGDKWIGLWITPTSPTAAAYVVETIRIQPEGFQGRETHGWEPAVIDHFNLMLSSK